MHKDNSNPTVTCHSCPAITELVYDGDDTGYILPDNGWEYRYFGGDNSYPYCPSCIQKKEQALGCVRVQRRYAEIAKQILPSHRYNR